MLNSFEELCIMRAAAENPFASVLNPHGGANKHIYIYIYTYLYIYIYIYIYILFTNGPEPLGSIPGKTQKMVFDASLLNSQHYKVGIKGKVGQSWERSRTLRYTSVLWLSKRELSYHPRLR